MKRQLRTQVNVQGFTLVEMVVVLIILGLIMAISVPSFRNSSARSALKSTTMDLISSINNSRAQAVSLGETATLEASDGSSWSNGWQMTMSSHSSENQNFRARENVSITATGGETTMDFRRDGTTSAQVTFRICHDEMAGENGREISINRLGRTTNKEYRCS